MTLGDGPVQAQELDLMILQSPFQVTYSVILYDEQLSQASILLIRSVLNSTDLILMLWIN